MSLIYGNFNNVPLVSIFSGRRLWDQSKFYQLGNSNLESFPVQLIMEFVQLIVLHRAGPIFFTKYTKKEKLSIIRFLSIE